jgi:hypothetical protein
MKNINQHNDLGAYRRHVRARIKPNFMTGCVFYTPPSLGEKSTVRTSPFSRGAPVRYGVPAHSASRVSNYQCRPRALNPAGFQIVLPAAKKSRSAPSPTGPSAKMFHPQNCKFGPSRKKSGAIAPPTGPIQSLPFLPRKKVRGGPKVGERPFPQTGPIGTRNFNSEF